MTIYFLYILLILTVLHILIRYRRMGRIVNKIPGPIALPFFGNMLSLLGPPEVLWNTMRKLASDYKILRLWFLTDVWVAVTDPDDIQVILTDKKNLDKRAVYELMIPFIDTGILTSGGEKWRQRRKLISSSFHVNMMAKYVDITSEHGERFINEIKSHGDETIEELTSRFSDLMLKIIIEAAMGVNLDNIDPHIVDDYKKSLYKSYELIIYRATRPYIRNWMLKLLPFLPLAREQNRNIKAIHTFAYKIINERREYLERNGSKSYEETVDDIENSTNRDSSKGKRRMAALDLLLAAEKSGLIDAKGVREEIDIYTIAGHDTGAMTMVFLLMHLAEEKEIQNRARAEADEVLRGCGGKLTQLDIKKLKYIDQCVKETLRLYPSIAQFLRYITEDIQLKDYTIPAGVDVLFPVYDIHRNPKHWAEPMEKFDPDRFLPENIKNRHPYAYIPFSMGLRNCIGYKFGLLEIKCMIALILHNFYLEPVCSTSSMKLKLSIVLQPADKVYVKYVTRYNK